MASVANNNSARKTNEARGTARLIAAPIQGGRLGELLITGKHYLCQQTDTGYRLCCKVDKQGNPVAYDLPADLSECDCPDATYRPRPGGCKHQRAMKALRAAGLLPAVGQ